jgi:N-acetylmuramoyl-L-alanine amidase
MPHLRLVLPLALLAVLVVIVGCESSSSSGSRSRVGGWESQLGAVPVDRKVAPVALLGEVRLRQDMIRPGTYGRRYKRPMNVRYITIHSTQNYTGNAYNHALALKRGALRAQKRRGGNRIGFLTWHFTVQDDVAIQHLPTNEQGEHADFDGPGNNYSIGIEMCEHRGNNLAQTIDRTAKLTAYLMHEHGLSIDRVVPHYHWPRRGQNPPNKNCPHFLLENGRPGATWRWFKARVQAHHSRLVAGPTPRI